MFQLILLLLFTLAGLSHQATSVEEAYVVGLFPEPVYEMVNTTGRDPNDQSIKITIQNMGSSANDVGYHAYLSDTAEALSFSMNTEGVSYRGKKVDHKEAREVFEKAKLEDHNAAVYIPRPLPVDRNSELQSESVNVHIKGEKKMTFNLEYTESIADKLASGEKVLNRAAVVLDMYGSTAENLFGEVFSPNYPNNYPNNADLAWWVRVPDDETVTLHVTDLDIEECCDRLTIYDGVSKNGQVVSVLTGQLSNESIVIQTTTNSIYLHLASDCSFTSRGFAATVTMSGNTVPTYQPPTTTGVYPTQPNVTACNGGDYLYSYSGSISSPNYPYSYYDNLYCSWHIRIPYYSYVVSMTVQDLHLQSYDYLRVYDGSSSYYPMIAQLTGVIHSNPTYHSSGTDMFLLLTTDSYGSTDSGFQLTYAYSYAQQTNNPTTTESNDVTTASALPTACNGGDYIYSYSGYIYTPNYPGNYYNSLSCSWQVRIPSTYYVVKLTVQAFQLEQNFDYLYVYDGPSSSYAQLTSWTGNHTQGETLYSSSRDMFLQLYTDYVVPDKGFQLYFANSYPQSTTPQPGSNIQACNGGEFLNSYSGSFSSPNYPSYYDNNLYCTWHIQMPSYSYAVNLTITDLQLQYNSDYLYIYDGPSINSPLLTYLTGSYYYSLMYYSTGRDMYVRLSTSSSGQDNGFQAFYTYTYHQQPATTAVNEIVTQQSQNTTVQACNGGDYIYSYSGYIYTPNYPGNYYNELSCSWQVRIPSTYYVVKLTVQAFQLEPNYDYLYVYDGPSSSYAQLASWTGNHTQGEALYSSSRDMFLQLYTDHSVTHQGFQLYFTNSYPQPGANIQACNGGEFLNSYSGSFTSPNYPSYYDNDLYCTWHIQMPSYSYAVNLTITDLQLQYNSDYLYIYDGPSASYPLLTYLTGSYYYPLMYYSTGRDMYVRLSTSSSGQDNGFQAFYTYTYPQQPATTAAITTDQACNGGEYINAYSGHIYSPNYPGNYYDYLDCSWQITIPYYYYVVKLTISDFNLEYNYDYLKVYDGSSDNYALLTMWTGNVNSGEKVYSSSYHMFLQFHTDSSVSSNGFSLSFDYASPSEASGEGSG